MNGNLSGNRVRVSNPTPEHEHFRDAVGIARFVASSQATEEDPSTGLMKETGGVSVLYQLDASDVEEIENTGFFTSELSQLDSDN